MSACVYMYVRYVSKLPLPPFFPLFPLSLSLPPSHARPTSLWCGLGSVCTVLMLTGEHARTNAHVHTLCSYYYVLYTHPERDQCYNESRQSVPDASSGPGQ